MRYFNNLSNVHNIEHGITEVGDAAPASIIRAEQVHKYAAAWVQHGSPALVKAVDSLVTRESNITLGVYCADCVPVLFVEPKLGIVGTVHAGWRGTALTVTRKTVEFLKAAPFKLIVGIGPAICPEHFQVGEEVARQFDASVVCESETEEGKFSVDLWQANVLQLLELGVPERNIEVMRVCTYENPNLHSFRRDHTDSRNIGFIRRRA